MSILKTKMFMTKYFKVLLALAFSMLVLPSHLMGAGSVHIIPIPQKVEMGEGSYWFNQSSKIYFSQNEAKEIADYLSQQSKFSTGYELGVSNKLKKNVIQLLVDATVSSNPEAYELIVNKNGIVIRGASTTGLFYGVQSFLQLVFPASKGDKGIEIPVVTINDSPQFKWRGLHLDVSRHFFSVEFVKKMLDMMALHKLNTFHWHLTDDQGWRIEIKKYPKLTQISSIRKETMVGHYVEENQQFDGVPYGGYYTQEQIKEVVAYAAKRFITVVPEIEMPGHAVAALAAYPELSCTGGPFEVYTKWGVSDDVFCAGNDKTFEFLQDIVNEVVELFPGQYIHIGGDECPKTRWKVCPKCQQRMKELNLKNEMELQSYFVKRMEGYVAQKGKRIIGWDEILEGGLPERASVMSWRGYEGGIEAANAGHDVVMTPGGYCYFDHYQADPANEPLAFGGLTTLEKVYEFDPIPSHIAADKVHHVLGAQANLWTEYIQSEEKAEYMLFPRLCALSEVLWSPKETRDINDFKARLDKHLSRLQLYGINYRK